MLNTNIVYDGIKFSINSFCSDLHPEVWIRALSWFEFESASDRFVATPTQTDNSLIFQFISWKRAFWWRRVLYDVMTLTYTRTTVRTHMNPLLRRTRVAPSSPSSSHVLCAWICSKLHIFRPTALTFLFYNEPTIGPICSCIVWCLWGAYEL